MSAGDRRPGRTVPRRSAVGSRHAAVRSCSTPRTSRCASCPARRAVVPRARPRRPRCSTTTASVLRSEHLSLPSAVGDPAALLREGAVPAPRHAQPPRACSPATTTAASTAAGTPTRSTTCAAQPRRPARVGERRRRVPAVQRPQARPLARRDGMRLARRPSRAARAGVGRRRGRPRARGTGSRTSSPHAAVGVTGLAGRAARPAGRRASTRASCPTRSSAAVWVARRRPRRPLVLGSGAAGVDATAGRRRRGRAAGAAAGARCCVVPGEVLWVDVVAAARRPALGRRRRPRRALAGRGVGGGADGARRRRRVVHTGAWSARRGRALVCFAGLGPGEVTVGGRKVVGISPAAHPGRAPASSASSCAPLGPGARSLRVLARPTVAAEVAPTTRRRWRRRRRPRRRSRRALLAAARRRPLTRVRPGPRASRVPSRARRCRAAASAAVATRWWRVGRIGARSGGKWLTVGGSGAYGGARSGAGGRGGSRQRDSDGDPQAGSGARRRCSSGRHEHVSSTPRVGWSCPPRSARSSSRGRLRRHGPTAASTLWTPEDFERDGDRDLVDEGEARRGQPRARSRPKLVGCRRGDARRPGSHHHPTRCSGTSPASSSAPTSS